MNFKIGLVAVLAFLALIFLVQNVEVVKVTFLFWEISMSRAVLIFFSLLIGFIVETPIPKANNLNTLKGTMGSL
jgi:lipopolysaccharide assembly protein A